MSTKKLRLLYFDAAGISASEPRPHREAAEYLCWSRMQAEAGQDLSAIIRRKELERRAGGGQFFWGVGNAPAVVVRALSRLEEPIEVVFSVMKSRPKLADAAPARTLVWRRYVDQDGGVRPLPPHALVTSRTDSASGPKTKHFALMCYSRHPLELRHGEVFDPNAYRNAGGSGGSVGASQVTALLRRVGSGSEKTDYEINLRAQLVGHYWVRLVDPIEWTADYTALDAKPLMPNDWLKFVGSARRSHVRRAGPDLPQGMLF
jgi:hypothetical protein